jgi:hypothetical protein
MQGRDLVAPTREHLLERAAMMQRKHPHLRPGWQRALAKHKTVTQADHLDQSTFY